MHHRSSTAIHLDQDALCRLNRLRRRTRQPLSRIVNAIVLDFLDSVRTEPRVRTWRLRPPRRMTRT